MKRYIKSFQNIISKLLIVFDKKQKQKSIWVLILIIFGSFLELIGVSAILPFLQAIITPDKLTEKWYIEMFLDIFNINTNQGMLIMLSIAIILLYIVKNIFLLFSFYYRTDFTTRITMQLSTKMLSSYMKRPYTYFIDNNSSKIIRGVHNDVSGVQTILTTMFSFASEVLTLLLVVIYLLYTDVLMAIVVIAIGIICLFVIVFGIKKKIRIYGKKSRTASAECYKHTSQAIQGIKEITIMQRRNTFVNSFEKSADVRRETSLSYTFLSGCPNYIMEAVCISGVIGIVCIRIGMGLEVASFVPSLGVFAMAAFKILPYAAHIANYLSTIIFYKPSLEEAYDNIISAKEFDKNYSDIELSRKDKKTFFEKNIEIEDISWKYENASEIVLDNLSLTIKKGEAIGIIGSSGAGKTTLADVILGLLKPQKGTIKMDGTDIFLIPDEWSKIIGYVPQSVYLLDDTIRNNITFGIEREEIDDEKVWKALEQAQLREFVENSPRGLDTIVGERGVKFSGGQRQRVSIARALYYNPEIIVLDEATSALDNETEQAVMESIDDLQKQKTLIIVAHRLTTIQNCDRIIEVKEGKAVEIDKKSIYE